jgi:vacuolar-type H+-ATPase subunit E/Vma4
MRSDNNNETNPKRTKAIWREASSSSSSNQQNEETEERYAERAGVIPLKRFIPKAQPNGIGLPTHPQELERMAAERGGHSHWTQHGKVKPLTLSEARIPKRQRIAHATEHAREQRRPPEARAMKKQEESSSGSTTWARQAVINARKKNVNNNNFEFREKPQPNPDAFYTARRDRLISERDAMFNALNKVMETLHSHHQDEAAKLVDSIVQEAIAAANSHGSIVKKEDESDYDDDAASTATNVSHSPPIVAPTPVAPVV